MVKLSDVSKYGIDIAFNNRKVPYEGQAESVFDAKIPQQTTKNKKKNKTKNTWFQSGAFSDGYQFGDFTKTVLGTAGDIGTNLAKGVVSAGESIGDLGAYAGAQVIDWTGKVFNSKGIQNYADEVRKAASESLTNKVFKPVDNIVDKNSVMGEKLDSVANSIGNMYAMGVTSSALLGANGNIPLNIGGKTFNMPVTSVISGASNSMSEATQKGAKDWQVWLNGALGGVAEGVSESLFGTFGLGGSDLDDAIVKGVTKKMKSGLAKTLATAGIKAVGEGTEEIASYLLNYAGTHALDYFKNVVDKDAPSLAEKFNKEELWENFFAGTLAGAVGGLPATVNMVTRNNRNNTNLPLPNTNIPINENLISQNNVKNSMSNLENSQPTNVYQYQKSDNIKVNNLRESASKYFNNSEQTHNFIDNISKIISDKDYNVIFDSNIVNDEGKTVNGQIKTLDNGEIEIRLNPNSPKSGEFLIIHEVTHAIETQEMKDLVLNFASQHDDFKVALKDLQTTYRTNDVSSEVLADISGELFGNQEFINNLSLEKPSIFKRIYNSIISLANKITGNSHEALFVRDLKNKWETAYRNTTQEQAVNNLNNNANYHISRNFSNEIDEVLTGKYKSNNQVKARDFTPEILVNNGVKDLPMLITAKHVKSTILTELEAKNSNMYEKNVNYHGLGKETLINVIDSLDNPTEIYKTSQNEFLIITEILDKQGNNIVVPIRIDGKGTYNNVYIEENQIKSAYGRKNITKYIQNNNFKKIYTKKGTTLNERVQYSNISNSSTESIPQSSQNVKLPTKYSMQNSQNNTLKQQQLDIVLKTNPAGNENATWIRTIDDVKTFEETLQDSDWEDWENNNFDPDYGADIVNEALNTGKITVYSSYPIEQGIFVTPSKMEAESYSGTGKVYSKEVNLTDVAWIDPTQGQYAKVDAKYSENSNSWQEYLDKHYKTSGTRTNMSDIKLPTSKDVNKINLPPVNNNINNKTLNPLEISKLTKEDANTTPKLPVVNRNTTSDGDSRFASNIENKVNMLNDEQKNRILSEEEVKYYDKVTNKESLEKAFEKINNGGLSETLNWQNRFAPDKNGQMKQNPTAVDIAEGWILMKQYADNKDYDSMVEIAKTMRRIGSTAGQTVQAFNILERMTPEGMVKYAQSELQEAYDYMIKNKSKEWIDKHREDFDLTPDEVQFIMDNMKEISTMEDGYDKRVKLAEIQKLMTDKLPPVKGAGIKSWMRISMLFNPKTQVRNVAGNALIMPINSFSDLFSNYADKIISKKTGVRTTGKTNIKAMLKGIKEGAYQATNDYKKGINTKDMKGNRFEITEGKNFNDKTLMGKSLNKVESMLNYIMDVGDRVFSQAAFENSLQNQMVLNNTTEITQDMLDIARTESLQRTWNDNNSYTKFVLDIRRMLNKIHLPGMDSYGVGDILIPFAKTPANLTKAIVDYSPVGMINTLVEGNNLRKSLTNGQFTPQMQHKFVQDLGKATAGTMLYVLGYALAKSGVISGEADDDKDVSNFMKNTLGISSYSIKIGNKSFTYDWAQPIAAPLSIMANIVQKQKENATLLENATSSLNTAGSILLEQSFFESIKTVFSNNDGVVSGIQEAILELPARAVPTFSKQIADMVDGTQRTSFEYDKPIKSAINSVKAKIPFVSKTLAPTVDTMGREVKKYGGKNNIFNVFLNPANVNTENISKGAEEIYNVYKATGDKSVMPRVPEYKYKDKDGNLLEFNSKDRANFQKISGNIVENTMKDLLKNSKYTSMSNEDKASVINDVVNYSYNKAREETLGLSMANTYNKINEYVSNGGKISDYYTNKKEIDYSLDYPDKYSVITNITTYDKYQKYKTELQNIRDNTDDDKTETIKYINSLNLSIPQRAIFIKQYYKTFNDYNKEIAEYINNKNLTIEEKTKILTELGFVIRDGRVYW